MSSLVTRIACLLAGLALAAVAVAGGTSAPATAGVTTADQRLKQYHQPVVDVEASAGTGVHSHHAGMHDMAGSGNDAEVFQAGKFKAYI